jgi:hypothetical protein
MYDECLAGERIAVESDGPSAHRRTDDGLGT